MYTKSELKNGQIIELNVGKIVCNLVLINGEKTKDTRFGSAYEVCDTVDIYSAEEKLCTLLRGNGIMQDDVGNKIRVKHIIKAEDIKKEDYFVKYKVTKSWFQFFISEVKE